MTTNATIDEPSWGGVWRLLRALMLIRIARFLVWLVKTLRL